MDLNDDSFCSFDTFCNLSSFKKFDVINLFSIINRLQIKFRICLHVLFEDSGNSLWNLKKNI